MRGQRRLARREDRPAFSDPGGETLGAPIGSSVWAKRVRLELQSVVDDLPKPITRAAGYVRLIHDHRAWEIMNRRDGSMFASFDEFCTAARPWGLGIPPAKLAAYLALKEES